MEKRKVLTCMIQGFSSFEANTSVIEILDCILSVANVSVFPSAAAGNVDIIYADIAHKKKSETKKTGKKRSTL